MDNASFKVASTLILRQSYTHHSRSYIHRMTCWVEIMPAGHKGGKDGVLGDAVRCNERDRLVSKQTNCNKAYSLLKTDED